MGNEPTNATDPSGNIIVFVHGIAGHNTEEVEQLTAMMNAYWDAIGEERQEIIHFYYGFGNKQTPFGAQDAWNDTCDPDNQFAGDQLGQLLLDLLDNRKVLGSDEPISVIAYSNGSNLAWRAAEILAGKGRQANQLLILGGSLDQDNDMSRFPKAFEKIYNFSSKSDGATWWVDGIGSQGFHPGVANGSSIFQLWIKDIYHSRGELTKKFPSATPWTGNDYCRNYRDGKWEYGSYWLTAFMAIDYYQAILESSGDGRVSGFDYDVGDDSPTRVPVTVPPEWFK